MKCVLIGHCPGKSVLAADLMITVGTDAFVIKQGFDTDGTTRPWFAGWLIKPFGGRTTVPSVLHDALYASEFYKRKKCDVLFLEAMRAAGVPDGKRWAMYLWVRLLGWVMWQFFHDEASVRESQRFITVRKVQR